MKELSSLTKIPHVLSWFAPHMFNSPHIHFTTLSRFDWPLSLFTPISPSSHSIWLRKPPWDPVTSHAIYYTSQTIPLLKRKKKTTFPPKSSAYSPLHPPSAVSSWSKLRSGGTTTTHHHATTPPSLCLLSALFLHSSPDTLTHSHTRRQTNTHMHTHTFAAWPDRQINTMLMTPAFIVSISCSYPYSERADTLSSNVYSLRADYC